MDRTAKENNGEARRSGAPKVEWSFRRFGADQQAKCATETWDELHKNTQPLLGAMGSARQNLYEVETDLEGAMNAAHLPKLNSCRSANREALSSARRLLTLLGDANQRLPPPPDPTLDSLLLEGTGRPGGDARPAVDVATGGTVNLEVSREELDQLIKQLKLWVDAAARMMSCCEATITCASIARGTLGDYDRRVRELVLSVWTINHERAKAFPPFFSDLGPIDPALYGMGRAKTAKPATAAPKRKRSTASTNTNKKAPG